MKRKLIPYLAYSALLLIAVGVTVFLYWLYSPPVKALDISPSPIPVVSKEVKPDEFVILEYTYCKNIKTTGRIVATLVNDATQVIIPVIITEERGERKCENNVKIPVPVPPQATPGEYHFHFRATYQVNPISMITQEFDTQSFKVN